MKVSAKVMMFTVLVVFIASTSMAGETLQQFKDIKGRSFHADFYDGKSCNACHSNKKPLNFPADDACLACHDLDELVAATARPADETLQNPHDNMHYGKEVPCMECHFEHETGKPMCAGCHQFKYPKYKH